MHLLVPARISPVPVLAVVADLTQRLEIGRVEREASTVDRYAVVDQLARATAALTHGLRPPVGCTGRTPHARAVEGRHGLPCTLCTAIRFVRRAPAPTLYESRASPVPARKRWSSWHSNASLR